MLQWAASLSPQRRRWSPLEWCSSVRTCLLIIYSIYCKASLNIVVFNIYFFLMEIFLTNKSPFKRVKEGRQFSHERTKAAVLLTVLIFLNVFCCAVFGADRQPPFWLMLYPPMAFMRVCYLISHTQLVPEVSIHMHTHTHTFYILIFMLMHISYRCCMHTLIHT